MGPESQFHIKGSIMSSVLHDRPRFGKSIAAELNFTAERLSKLPAHEIRAIYDGLHSEMSGEAFARALRKAIDLICDAPVEDLTRYLNEAFGDDLFDAYIFTDARAKVPLFAWFFFNHLVREGDSFTVKRIDLATLEVS